MKSVLPRLGLFLLAFCAGPTWTWAAGPLQRVPNTSLALPAQPPSPGYTYTNAFGNLTFNMPVAIVTPPGETNRVFVVEKGGRIQVITNLANPTKTLFMDISSYVVAGDWTSEQGLLAMAFHPGYLTNGYFYVLYTEAGGTPWRDTLERYTITA